MKRRVWNIEYQNKQRKGNIDDINERRRQLEAIKDMNESQNDHKMMRREESKHIVFSVGPWRGFPSLCDITKGSFIYLSENTCCDNEQRRVIMNDLGLSWKENVSVKI